IDIPADQVPLAIDEFPALFVAAASAAGVTRLREASELRVKESDRLKAMADGFETLGIAHRLVDDGIDIVGYAAGQEGQGQQSQGPRYGGGRVDSLGDHRIAMAFTVAALRASDEILVDNCANVATSFPDFVELARRVGLSIEQEAE